jgi:DNA-binding response OmpR family regulator
MQTILVADDQDHLRLLVRSTLDDPQFTVVEAADGREALELARRTRPDLMILDWMMPEMSGVEVLAQLREDRDTTAIPVIMLTAKAQKIDRNQALLLGIRAYLIKPFSPVELLDRVHKALKPIGTSD